MEELNALEQEIVSRLVLDFHYVEKAAWDTVVEFRGLVASSPSKFTAGEWADELAYAKRHQKHIR